MFSSKQKKQSVNLLIEEIPTVEKRKYLAYKIFDNWKCSFCEQHDETFDHDRTYSETKITFIDLIKVGTFGLIGA
ncbi:hypothetical protein RhiirC2_799373 [Rhizophagus irregularis]|uniref:Uncharacterized protein n=1 Tax=Rhizophagus irregularis TaxID=588596 RepID=A0A2N1M518_9GLOM|nr:hypothetical protein RhiirC2_799373 [Rhizophagus irregularis]